MEHSPYDYHYGNEAEQYRFYRLPKALFTDERYKKMSDSAKILYGLMLDRMSLSNKNGWVDDKNRIYIIFTLDEVQEYINCKHEKAVKLLAELDTEKGVGLIERIKRGQGKPAIIYVRKFFETPACHNSETLNSRSLKSEGLNSEKQNSSLQTSENQKSATPNFPQSKVQKNGSQEFGKTEANDTNINNTDLINTPSFPIFSPAPMAFSEEKTEMKGTEEKEPKDNLMDTFEKYEELIHKNIEYPLLIERYPYDREKINEIVALMLETVCTARKTIFIAGDEYPAELVKSKYLKLTSKHIEFVLDCLRKNTSDVRNIKKYLLAVLFNATTTIDNFYSALVAHDLYGEK